MVIEIRPYSELLSLRDEWERLILSSYNPSITQSWEWMKTWWDVYGKERKLLVLCAYQDDTLVGIAPLSIGRERTSHFKCLKYKTIWFLGSGKTKDRGVVSDYLDFIVEKGNEKRCIKGFLEYLSNHIGWDEIILENISAESDSLGLLQRFAKEYGLNYNIINETPTILIKLPKSWDEYLKSTSGSLRYKIKRGRKEFAKLGGTYGFVEKKSELYKVVEALERLHQYRWSSKGIAGAFSSPEWKTFHMKLIPLLFDKGYLNLSYLGFGNEIVAVHYGFSFNNRLHFFQSGMIPHQNKHVRLGLLLHSYCIEEAIKEGCKEYDFLQIGASGPGYKTMWGNYSRDLLTIRIYKQSNKEKLYATLQKGLMLGRKLKSEVQQMNFRRLHKPNNT